MRYDQLLDIIDEIKPRSIVEVGVARAERAEAMSRRALTYWPDVEYVGYDVFETRDQEFQKAAFNLKTVGTHNECASRLRSIQEKHEGFKFKLVIGETRDTLQGKRVNVDLAFVDGDHRVNVIFHDYDALKDSGVVVLDDFYTPDDNGNCVDVNMYGCNRLFDHLPVETKWSILPVADQVRGGGRVQMVVVRR